MKGFVETLSLGLLFGWVATCGFGLYRSWIYMENGLAIPAIDMFREAAVLAFPAGLYAAFVFVAGYLLLLRLFSKSAVAAFLATGVALGPFALYALYYINKWYLPGFFESKSLLANSGMTAASVLVWVGLGAWLSRWSEKRFRGNRRARFVQPAALALLAFALYIGGGALMESQHPTRIVFILVDALRPDRLGCYGNSNAPSPNIDRLAGESVLFTNAISQGTFTKTSVASLFSSLNPYRHGVYIGNEKRDGGVVAMDVLGDQNVTLAEALLNEKLITKGIVHNIHLTRSAGFGQGFVEYHEQQGSIQLINTRMTEWLNRIGKKHSFFAYLHYIDVHDPYLPRKPFDVMYGTESPDFYARFDLDNWGHHLHEIQSGNYPLSEKDIAQLQSYYDGLIRFVDGELGKLFDEMKRLGIYENTMIVFTSDHGDGFMEHGFISHSKKPYEELVRVPLLIRIPGGEKGGGLFEGQVRLIDVPPTLVEFAGGEPPGSWEGVSLFGRLEDGGEGSELPDRIAYAISEKFVGSRENRMIQVSVRREDYKYLIFEDGSEEFYSLVSDPGEMNNLIDERSELAEPFRRIAEKMAAERTKLQVDSAVLDDGAIEELKALGYVK